MNEPVPPPIDSERWSRIEALFHEAAELPPERRSEFLERACGEDVALRRAVERFLQVDASSAALDHSLEEWAAPLQGPSAGDADGLPPGTMVGRYRITDVLGRGGMGTVYRAERADGAYQRTVALKVAGRERLSDQALGRFHRERQILAGLHHPGIASLLDGGTTEDGHPFLVMELIEGVPITAYARERGLSVQARIELGLQVIDAVDHAHRALVVHRDLKPSNILVTAAGAVKLLDFGIARLIEQDELDDEGLTHTGVMLLTPEYAAPEQIRGEPVTTAVDVYAAGAVLYELLALRKPYGSVARSWSGLQRVLETAPPPLSQADGLDARTRRALDGDLETIVQKAMHKDPLRRYPSVQALGDDLRRYLQARPVLARPDSVGYRLSKLLRRNRVAAAASVALLVAIGVGGASTLRQARLARLEAERGRAVGEFLVGLFEGADPDLHPEGPVSARELLEVGAARIDSLAAGPAARVDLLTTLGSLFGKVGDYDRAETLLEQAVAEARSGSGVSDAALARALDELGVRRTLTGDVGEAEPVLRQALEQRRAHGADPLAVAATEGNLAAALRNLGRLDESADLYRSAIDRLAGTGSDSLDFASELMGLGQVRQDQDRVKEAVDAFRTVLRLHRDAGLEIPFVAIATHNLGVALAQAGDYQPAEQAHRDALALWQRLFPGGHPEIARSHEALGRVLARQGRWAEADSAYGRAIALWQARTGPNDSQLATMQANRANLHFFAGDFAAAAEAYSEAVRIFAANDQAVLLGAGLRNLGIIQMEAGDLRAADTLLASALTLRRQLNGDVHTAVAETHGAIAGLRNLEGRHRDAEAEARLALERYAQLIPEDDRLVFNTRLQLGIALAGQRRYAEAREHLETVYARFAETENERSAALGRAELWLAVTVQGLGDRERAAALAGEALPRLRAGLRPGAPELALADQLLGATPGP